jgi:hypothetical protein
MCGRDLLRTTKACHDHRQGVLRSLRLSYLHRDDAPKCVVKTCGVRGPRACSGCKRKAIVKDAWTSTLLPWRLYGRPSITGSVVAATKLSISA